MAGYRKPLAIVAEKFALGYHWAADNYDVRKWRWNMENGQVRDKHGLVVEAQVVTKEEQLKGCEFRDLVIVGQPSRKLIDLAKTRVR